MSPSEIELKETKKIYIFFSFGLLFMGFIVIYEMSSTVDESTKASHPHTQVSVSVVNNTVLAGCRYYKITVNQL